MTGFAGMFSAEPLEKPTTERLLREMAEDITYASDDVVDTWQSDHLAVTRVHHGVLKPEPQPIFNEDGSICVVMEGEVFDYDRERRNLEKRGHPLRFAENDAEYCLRVYEEYGVSGLEKLNGSFALMIHDLDAGEVLLVADRVVSHAVYYHQGGDWLIFGTQLRPLLRHRGLPRQLDLRTVFEFFALGCVLWDHTFYTDVKALPPATCLRIRHGESELVRYWCPKSYTGTSEPLGHYAEELAHTLREAVRRKTRGEHRFGILLSGGLDSRMVVAAAEKPLVAFTLGEFENLEVDIARRAARAGGAEHVFVKRGPDHYADLVDEAIAIGDGTQPFQDALVLGTTDEMRERCDVILDAFGFDCRLKGVWAMEHQLSLRGRTLHFPRLLEIKDVTSVAVLERVPWFDGLRVFSDLFRAPHKRTAKEEVITSLRDALARVPALHPQDHIAFPMAGSFRSIEGYLMVQATRAHLPQRSLILDNDLLDLSLAIPPEFRARGRVVKKALGHLSPEMAAIPDSNSGLRADLPVWMVWLVGISRIALHDAGILSPPKVPCPTCTHRSWPRWSELVRHNARLRTMIERTVQDPECLDPDLFDIPVVEGKLHDHLERRKDAALALFALLTFGRWYKRFGPG